MDPKIGSDYSKRNVDSDSNLFKVQNQQSKGSNDDEVKKAHFLNSIFACAVRS